MKNLFLLFLITLVSSCSLIRDIGIRKQFTANFLKLDDARMKKSPITNREYLIFLSWQIDVFGHSYPEKIISLLPTSGLDLNKISATNSRKINYQSLLDNITNSIFQSYTLNPKYLDYPLIGLSKNQNFEVLKWLNDRYNEYSLIENGFLYFNPAQRNADSFVIEAHEANQYVGGIRKNLKDERTGGERAVRWSDGYFIPAFRLPYETELPKIDLYFEQPFELQPYKFHKNHFLSLWNNHYLDFKEEMLILNTTPSISLPLQNSTFQLNKIKIEKGKIEGYCYQNIKYLEYSDQETVYAYPEKDKYGHMDFLIIGEDSLGNPITGQLKNFADGEVQKNMISWVFYDTQLMLQGLWKE